MLDKPAVGNLMRSLIDEALRSFLLRHRAAELDAEYDAYDVHPLDEPDEWGDLASFRGGGRSELMAGPVAR